MTHPTTNKFKDPRTGGRLPTGKPAKRVAVFSLGGQIDKDVWSERLHTLESRFEIAWLQGESVRSLVRQVLVHAPDVAVHPIGDRIEDSLRLLRCLTAFELKPLVVVLAEAHSPELEQSVRQLGGLAYTLWPEDRHGLHQLLTGPARSRSQRCSDRPLPRSLMA